MCATSFQGYNKLFHMSILHIIRVVCVRLRTCVCACEGAGVRVCVRVSLHMYVCLCVCLHEGLCYIAFYIGYI